MKHTVLTLNHNPDILGFINALLDPEDYCHLCTTDSHHALSVLRLLREEFIDLFIQDIDRSEMDGFELYRRIKSEEQLRNIPILILTGYSAKTGKVYVGGGLPGRRRKLQFELDFESKVLHADAYLQVIFLFNRVRVEKGEELIDTGGWPRRVVRQKSGLSVGTAIDRMLSSRPALLGLQQSSPQGFDLHLQIEYHGD